jgi:cytochrome c oxidase assembly protein subunit 15
VIFQAALGMWTVTLLLYPPVVMGHLLGGMALLALLVLLVLRQGSHLRFGQFAAPWLKYIALSGLVVLALQIALGGWTSTNYAAIACPDFPTCQGQWWPPMNFSGAFWFWHPIGIDYAGGVLHNSARVAIHFTHRLGALATFIILGTLSLILLFRARSATLKRLGGLLGIALIAQVSIGISMVELQIPLSLADAHTAFAALLLIATVTVNHALWSQPRTSAAIQRR